MAGIAVACSFFGKRKRVVEQKFDINVNVKSEM